MGVAPIKMPQLGESVTEGTVDKWLKREGDHVKRDEPLVEVVTDKVNAEIPSPFEGTLLRIGVAEGATVAIGTVLAEMEVEGAAPAEAAEPKREAAAPAEAAEPKRETAPAEAAAPLPAAAAAGGEARRFSPAVRRLAEEHGLDPSSITGTGEGGRVTRDDVLGFIARSGAPEAAGGQAPGPAAAAPASAPAGGPDEQVVRISAMRRSIAEHMTRSLATSPHAWTLQEIDMSALVAYREAEKEAFRQRHGAPLTYLPFAIQVLADALREHPFLNATWTDAGIALQGRINVGLAVAVPDGLIVPVIRDADRLGFTDLARLVGDLVGRARSRQLRPEDVQGGTFTLNNTGATGSVASQPIINQPQAAILTMEAIVRRPVVVGEGIAIRPIMNMCLAFDHRIIDGMMAGQFLGYIKNRLETWTPAAIRL